MLLDLSEQSHHHHKQKHHHKNKVHHNATKNATSEAHKKHHGHKKHHHGKKGLNQHKKHHHKSHKAADNVHLQEQSIINTNSTLKTIEKRDSAYHNAKMFWQNDFSLYQRSRPESNDCTVNESENWKGAQMCAQSWECRG